MIYYILLLMEKPIIFSGCLHKLLLLLFVWGAFPATFAAYSMRKEFSEQLKWIYYYDQVSTYDFKIVDANLRRPYRGSYYFLVRGEVQGQFATISMGKAIGEAIFVVSQETRNDHDKHYLPRPERSIVSVYAIPSQKLAQLPDRYGNLTAKRKLIYRVIPVILIIYLPVLYAWYHLIRIAYILLIRWQRKRKNTSKA